MEDAKFDRFARFQTFAQIAIKDMPLGALQVPKFLAALSMQH